MLAPIISIAIDKASSQAERLALEGLLATALNHDKELGKNDQDSAAIQEELIHDLSTLDNIEIIKSLKYSLQDEISQLQKDFQTNHAKESTLRALKTKHDLILQITEHEQIFTGIEPDTLKTAPPYNPTNEGREENKGLLAHLAQLWRGELGLPITYWAWGVLGGIVWGVVFQTIESADGQPYYYSSVSDFLTLAKYCFGAYYFVVYVGIWRAASKYTGNKAWAILSKFVIILTMAPVLIAALIKLTAI